MKGRGGRGRGTKMVSFRRRAREGIMFVGRAVRNGIIARGGGKGGKDEEKGRELEHQLKMGRRDFRDRICSQHYFMLCEYVLDEESEGRKEEACLEWRKRRRGSGRGRRETLATTSLFVICKKLGGEERQLEGREKAGNFGMRDVSGRL